MSDTDAESVVAINNDPHVPIVRVRNWTLRTSPPPALAGSGDVMAKIAQITNPLDR